MTKYEVYWDNGNHACGTFAETFDTEEAAEAFGKNWRHEMCAIDGIDPDDDTEDTYTFEIIEIENDPEPDAASEEADWYAELNRGYERDRL